MRGERLLRKAEALEFLEILRRKRRPVARNRLPCHRSIGRILDFVEQVHQLARMHVDDRCVGPELPRQLVDIGVELQAHGSIGSSCAVADVQADHATIWSPTQSVYPTQHGASALLGLPLDSVRVIFVRGSGCYGLNAADTVSYDAALLSQAVHRPVRVQLTRQDEFVSENYGAACVIEQQAAINVSGAIDAWSCETWAASLGGRPGYEKPGNVITGMLAGFQPEASLRAPRH